MTDTPAFIVSGYLGAGKTTLINTFLHEPQGLRATILVNDFGAINLDAALIENTHGRTIALTNGCACCSIGDDLLAAVQDAMKTVPDLLIVEASGVAEPARLANLLMGVANLEPARIATLINAAVARRNATDKFIARLFTSQIAAADAVLVNRSERLEDSTFVSGLINRHAPQATMAQGLHNLLKAEPAPRLPPSVPDPTTTFGSYVITVPEGLTEPALQNWLACLPAGVERIKGHARLSGADMWVDHVQGKTALRPCPSPLETMQNRLVLIAAEHMDQLLEINAT